MFLKWVVFGFIVFKISIGNVKKNFIFVLCHIIAKTRGGYFKVSGIVV